MISVERCVQLVQFVENLNSEKLFLIYLLVINIITFMIYGIDKFKSKHGFWRISERTLLIMGIIGGGFGGYLAMIIFRHKTLKTKFYIANFFGILITIYFLYKNRWLI